MSSSCQPRQFRRSVSLTPARPPNGSRRGRCGRNTISCSAARRVHRWTAGTYERSFRRLPRPHGSARRGRPRTAALVRVHPQCQRCPAGGYQRPGRAQQHVRHPRRYTGTRSGRRPPRARRPRTAQPEGEGCQADLSLAPGTDWLPSWLPNLQTKSISDQSGRRDLNPRPLDPQSRITRLGRSEGVGRGAFHLRQRPEGVAGSLSKSTCIGSRSWLPWLPWAGEGPPHVNQDQRRLDVPGDRRSRHRNPRRSANTPRPTVRAPGSSRVTRAACSPGTRPSRPWSSRNGSPPATATMTGS